MDVPGPIRLQQLGPRSVLLLCAGWPGDAPPCPSYNALTNPLSYQTGLEDIQWIPNELDDPAKVLTYNTALELLVVGFGTLVEVWKPGQSKSSCSMMDVATDPAQMYFRALGSGIASSTRTFDA